MTQTTSRLMLPEGYGVAQLEDKQWYPVKVTRFYSAENPEGLIDLETLWSRDQIDRRCSHRDEAVRACWQDARKEEASERERWERLAAHSEVYPDRCAHYLEMIEELTGHLPRIDQWLWSTEIKVMVSPGRCFRCGTYHDLILVSAQTLEEALEEAAELAYEAYAECMQSHTVQKLVSIRIA